MVCACVGELADTLKPEYAAALRRVEIDGMSVKDYAEEAGGRVFRAREALRKQARLVPHRSRLKRKTVMRAAGLRPGS